MFLRGTLEAERLRQSSSVVQAERNNRTIQLSGS